MINNQKEAHDWMIDIQLCAQRAKSKLLEHMLESDKDPMFRVVTDLNPHLFPIEGEIDIVSMTDRYSQKTVLTRTDVMSVMIYVFKCPVVEMEARFREVYLPDDNPMDFFRVSELPLMG